MMNDAKDGKINTIIVKDLSRFGRNYLKVGAYISEIFPEMGIRFIAIGDDVDSEKKEPVAPAANAGAGMDGGMGGMY